MIRAAFFGTPEEAVPVLHALAGVADVELVVTRPDKPKGRSGKLLPPPVKIAAEELDIPIAQPPKVRDVAPDLEGLDVAVVAAYGRIIPGDVLPIPEAGFVNIHFSLLPRWRGASPVVRAILAGDAETGVTLMQMDEGLDTGAMLVTESTPIAEGESTGELTMRLADIGARLIATHLAAIVAGDVEAVPQDDAAATAAGLVSVDEAFLDLHRHSTTALLRAVRAFNPKPGAWGLLDGERFKVWRAAPFGGAAAPDPGVAAVVEGEVVLGARDGAIRLAEVQPAGRPRMDAVAWMNGRRGEPARFDQAG